MWSLGDRVLVDSFWAGRQPFPATVIRVHTEDGLFVRAGEVSVLPDGESSTVCVSPGRVHKGSPDAAAQRHFVLCCEAWGITC